MNVNQGALYFGAGIDLNQWHRDIESMRRDISGLTSNVQNQTRNIDSAFKNLYVGIAGYLSVNALKGFAMELINVRGEFQKTEIAFSTMLGSADKARVLMGQMVDLAAKTPFGLQEVSAGAKQLLAFQVPANQVVDVLTRMGNIAAGLGVPLSRINLVYGQVRAKGRLMGDDLRQFTEAGIPMVAELAKKFNKTTAEISAMVSAGKIGFNDVKDVLFAMTNEGGMFFNLMEKQSASLSGKVANLGDQWNQMLNKIGASNEGILYSGIEGLAHLVEHYEEMFQIITTLVAAYGTYKAAVIVTASAQAFSNKTLATEIGLLSASQRWKLGRALVTQRQTAATVLETQAERASLSAKYATLQAEVSSLAVKKQKAVALGVEKAQALGNARVQLALAQAELRSLQANGTAREVLIATKNVEKAQNTVIAAQQSAEITRRAALTAGTQFYTTQKELEATAVALTAATKNAETASEVANVAAKNANTLATTRLTLVQHAQTLAMGAASRAAAFLNATLFANPYALAAALIATLTYAVYKYSSALTQAEESQKRMNDDMKNQIPAITEQESKLKSLVKVIGDHKTSEDLRASSLKQVQTITNGRLTQLDEEAVKTGKASNMIQQYIEMLKLEAEAKRYVNELGRLDANVNDLKNNRGNFGLGDMWDDFTDFDSDFHWNLKDRKKERVDRVVKEMEAEKVEIQKKLDNLAKKGVNISETPINEIPTVTSKKGWAQSIKDQIETLEAEADNAKTRSAYLRIQGKIKKLQELLNPKKDKDTAEKQIAEILPIGSIKELQRRVNLIQDAIDTAVNGQVKLRKLDKYGKDTDKNGNPYLTGEIISVDEAGKRIDELNAEIKKRQYKSFDDEMSELERQWKVKYQLAKYYGQEVADAQFPELKGSYYADISKRFEDLNEKRNSGVNLSNSELSHWEKLKDILSTLTGDKDPLSNFNDSMDAALAKLPSLSDQIDYLYKTRDSQQNSGVDKGFFSAADGKLQEKLKEQKAIYQEFLNEQRTFEEKKLEIEKKYDDIRKRLQKEKGLSDTEIIKRVAEANKKEGEEVAKLNLEGMQKTDLWAKAFGDLSRIGTKTLKLLRSELEKYLQSEDAKNLAPDEIKPVIDAYNNLGKKLEENPFEKITIATDNYKKKLEDLKKAEQKYGKSSPQFQAALEDVRVGFVGIMEAANEAAKFMTNAVVDSIDAFGGISDEAKKTIKEVQNLVDGLVNAVSGYFSGNYAQMVSGIVQALSALGQLLNGDDQKAINIRKWQAAVDDLKFSYEQLQYAIERTAGEGQLKMQTELIANLKEQQRIIEKMRSTEAQKKKADQDKILAYTQQINEINFQIQQLVDDFKDSIVTVEFKELSQKIADALIDAFAQGEDAATAFDKVVDEVMRNAVANALKIRFLDDAAEKIVDQIYASMGYDNSGATATQQQLLNHYQEYLKDLEKQIQSANPLNVGVLQSQKAELEEKIKQLQAEIAANAMNGNFDGLTDQERDEIKALGTDAMNQYMAALQQYEDLFGSAAENAQGLKGDIKGITEKTAGALEAQFNAMRINLVAVLQIAKKNNIVHNAANVLLSQIEVNTRRLHTIDKNISEMNSKMKGKLAGIP